TDVEKVCDILMQVADSKQEVCRNPRARVRMRAFGPSSLDFELLCWIKQPEDRGRVKHELYMAVYNAFRTAGIEIPYTKQDVYIKEMPGG
ncbi:MAG: mechanosensitive ion channel, partial [Gammaproteobacteria bacterium]|nr:mechanosensitive ion channel [Gammaproteobacteria bacterium]